MADVRRCVSKYVKALFEHILQCVSRYTATRRCLRFLVINTKHMPYSKVDIVISSQQLFFTVAVYSVLVILFDS